MFVYQRVKSPTWWTEGRKDDLALPMTFSKTSSSVSPIFWYPDKLFGVPFLDHLMFWFIIQKPKWNTLNPSKTSTVLKPCGRSFTTSQNFFRHFKNLSIDFWCFPIYYIQIISGSWSLALKIWWLLPLSEPRLWVVGISPATRLPIGRLQAMIRMKTEGASRANLRGGDRLPPGCRPKCGS